MMKSLGCVLILMGLILGLAGCQAPPTKTYETKQTKPKDEKVDLKEVLIIDARPPFLSSLAKPNGAIAIQWEDFTEKEAPFEGYLEKDLFFHARRLARLGINPATKVLIVGRGRLGEGEEGRLAWTFKRMGLKNVKFASLDSLNWPMTKDPAPARAEVPIWKPIEDDSLEIKRLAALDEIKKSKSKELWVLDVRSEKEYLLDQDPFQKLNVHPGLINIPWTEFINEKGEAQTSVTERLKAVGVHPEDRILVLDEKGVRSAGVTLILRDLGYAKASNWSGGYREIRWFLRR